MDVVIYGESRRYVPPAENSNSLIINLEGSRWNSVLGVYTGRKWVETQHGAQLLQKLNDKYTFLIPEKLKRQQGKNHENDMNGREHYTAENLVMCYSKVINGYLDENNFSSIILIGVSKGALLIPLIGRPGTSPALQGDKDSAIDMMFIKANWVWTRPV
jgi:hypothetical protein